MAFQITLHQMIVFFLVLAIGFAAGIAVATLVASVVTIPLVQLLVTL